MKKLITPLLFLLAVLANAQTPGVPAKPKLVVGIVVDQMRWDYLYRYAEKYGSGGFKRLLNEGYNCQNTYINYAPSFTACGHSCVYTGSVPALHGIAGNYWFNRELGRHMASVEDTSVKRVGEGKLSGKISPHNLLTTTIGDEMHQADNFQSKVIGIALKDRSAVLPAGHTGNAAYFMDGLKGNFISTTYYMQQLPAWVNAFNEKKLAAKYLADNWSTVLPAIQYTESTEDDAPFEQAYENEEKPVFIHKVNDLTQSGYDVISRTPYGNTITLDFAKAAITGENLGKGKFTDLLAVSLSSTDIIGHQFGPNSVEIEDCYIRLDKELALFFAYLDQQVGKGNYLLFLTADHGAAHAAGYSNRHKIPAGNVVTDSLLNKLNRELVSNFGEGTWVHSLENMQVCLNHNLLEEQEVDREDVFKVCRNFMLKQEYITNLVDLEEVAESSLQSDLKERYINGYYPKRSGDFQIVYNPAWVEDFEKGTTHGTPYTYDTHIPLVWMGWKVKHGETTVPAYMTDIAPTIAALLHIQEPNGTVGKVIQGIFGN